MIIVKLMGGLGNQMFQYAYAYNLAKKFNEELFVDTRFYPADGKININDLMVPELKNWEEAQIKKSERKYTIMMQKIYHVLQKLIRIMLRTDKLGEKLFNIFSKRGYCFNFDPYFYEYKKETANTYLYGYFQGEQYFKEVVLDIKQQFKVKTQLSENTKKTAEQIEQVNSVALHIRLGDYTQKKNCDLYVCTKKYYEDAIKYFKNNVEEPRFFVFTNDLEEAKKLVDFPEETFFVENTQDYEDLALMYKCKHFIISNSTFSWWGAYLSENPYKKIVAPDKFRRTQNDEPAIYIKDMIKIEV